MTCAPLLPNTSSNGSRRSSEHFLKVKASDFVSSFIGLQVKQTNKKGKIEIMLTNMIEETHAKFKSNLKA